MLLQASFLNFFCSRRLSSSFDRQLLPKSLKIGKTQLKSIENITLKKLKHKMKIILFKV